MGEAKRKQEVLVKAQAEAERWGARLIRLDVDLGTMLVISGALQLALRHPAYTSSKTAAIIRSFIIQLKDQIGAEDYPALKQMIEMGFHKKYDE